METKKTLYISDLDGTLLYNDCTISDYSVNCINTAISQGMYFSFATARTAATALKITKRLNINAPSILMNGVAVFDTQQMKYININSYSNMDLEKLVSIIKNYNLSGFLFSINEKTSQLCAYYENLETPNAKEFMDERVKKFDKKFVQVSSYYICKNTIDEKFVYYSISDKKEKLTNAFEHLRSLKNFNVEFYRDTYNQDFWYLEISSSKASKLTSLEFIKNKYGFEKIISFGDNLNDLPLFKGSDFSLCPKNAKDEVKQSANMIIDYNFNDGVAKYIDKYFLEKAKKE